MADTSRIHLIGNAHLDPIWLWRWQEGCGEVLQTFRSALDRLKEYKDFVFTCSSAATDIYAGLFYGEYTTSAADMYVHTCTLNAGSPVVTNMTACGIAVGKLTSGTMLLGKGTNKFTIRPLTFNGKTYSAGYEVTESDLKGAGDGTILKENVVVAK